MNHRPNETLEDLLFQVADLGRRFDEIDSRLRRFPDAPDNDYWIRAQLLWNLAEARANYDARVASRVRMTRAN